MGTGTSSPPPGAPPPGTAPVKKDDVPETTKAKQDVEALIQVVEEKREIIAELARTVEGGRGIALPKARGRPDLTKLSLEQLQEQKEQLDQELQDLDDKEHDLNQMRYKTLGRGSIAGGPSGSVSGTLGPGGHGRKSGKVNFGKLTPEEIAIMSDPNQWLFQEHEWGLRWDRKWQDQWMGPPDEKCRGQRREGTKRKVVQELGLTHFGQPAWEAKKGLSRPGDLHAYFDQSAAGRLGNSPPGGRYLLGRYDLVMVKTNSDLDRNWQFAKGKKGEFWVLHAAAINIGESKLADDFPDFVKPPTNQNGTGAGSLDEEAYYRAMEQIIANVVWACTESKAHHLVFFPFGMGAFLRHLGRIDEKFVDQAELQRLRRRLANSFVKVLGKLAPKTLCIHLCLMFSDEEAQANADALLRAFAAQDSAEAAKLRPLLTVHPEGDALQVASDLGEKDRNVVLLNGANRCLLGNHWFAGRAKKAIDENLHRRSWRMAATAYLINGYDGHDPTRREPNELQQNVTWLGGRCHQIQHKVGW